MRAGGWIPLMLILWMGCAPSTRTLRLDLDRHPPRAAVHLHPDEFKKAVHSLGRDATVSLHPRETSLRRAEERSRPHPYARLRLQLGVVSSKAPPHELALSSEAADATLTRAYGRWCERRNTSGDCLRLLDRGLSLDEEARRTLAFHIALGSVWDETAEALSGLADKEALLTLLSTTGAVYLGLWLLPEPISKGVAAILTVGLITYLGWDTVWRLIQGFRELSAQARVATTFDELRGAGERYGEVMGQSAARVFVLLLTAAIGSSAQTMAAKLPTLPCSGQASLGVALGGLETVAVSSTGVVTIAWAPGVTAVTAHATGATAMLAAAGWHEHHIATNKWNDATHSGGPWTPRFEELFERAGLSLDDAANKVRIQGHKGPHPQKYHEEVYERLRDAVEDCIGVRQCGDRLRRALHALSEEISTPGSRLNTLVTRSE